MRVFLTIFAVVAVISAIMLGNSFVLAGSPGGAMSGGQAVMDCERNFNTLDSGQKDYLTYWDFEAGTYGVGGHKGLAPSGNAQSRFQTADQNRDNLLSRAEYCDWKNRS